MSSDEDDYLSDKFLAAVTPTSAAPKTYRDLRRQAARRAEENNAANRTKSTRERERDAREEGLSKTLFERAAEETSGSGSSKALQMMMRMGFQPGKALGGAGDDNEKRPDSTKTEASSVQDQEVEEPSAEPSMSRSKGPLVNPLPLNDWTGKQGIGVNKRAAEALERAAKVKRVTEEQDASSYRERARGEFELRRAEARLEPAQRTCIQLDERQGVQFNTLWLSSKDPSAFPDGLWRRVVHFLPTPNTSHEEQLRRQMRQDALQPLGETLDDVGRAAQKEKEVDPAVVEDVIRFLQLDSVDRLSRVLEYLRERYQYCFWCGTEYTDEDDFAKNCPGPDEDMHD